MAKKRQRRLVYDAKADLYGVRESAPATFSTGCTLLDCVLGGGWALDRVANLVGDKSTGKTLLAIEACANFLLAHPTGTIVYTETEAAFDEDYAKSLGLSLDRIEFPNHVDSKTRIETVEDLFEDLERRCASKSNNPVLYVVDSMDSLSDRGEMANAIDKASFGAAKAKTLSQMFRRLVGRFQKRRLTLLIVSQLRDAIGVMFGEKQKRSGGRALDFYSSQIVWLHHKGQLKKVKHGVERVVGVQVRAHTKKNKLGPPFRECEFPILFGFGVEDVQAAVEWLIEVKRTALLEMTPEQATAFVRRIPGLNSADYREWRARLSKVVRRAWAAIEHDFGVERRKY